MQKAFTLIELIFVIVIIGVLSAVAIPKFMHLKENAEVSTMIKTTHDIVKQAVELAVNYADLENNNSFKLKEIIDVHKKNNSQKVFDSEQWSCSGLGNYCHYNSGGNEIVKIILHPDDREIEYTIDCSKFDSEIKTAKCKKLLGLTDTDKISETVSY